MDPEYFTEKSRIEVYDNEGPVHNLNELEYIDGCIWANDYMVVENSGRSGKRSFWL
jgi:Glutamine cyclotransferase